MASVKVNEFTSREADGLKLEGPFECPTLILDEWGAVSTQCLSAGDYGGVPRV
jgi:hypothetical protein